jgi:hypothetical protein
MPSIIFLLQKGHAELLVLVPAIRMLKATAFFIASFWDGFVAVSTKAWGEKMGPWILIVAGF